MRPDALPQEPPEEPTLSAVAPSEGPGGVQPQVGPDRAVSRDPREPVLSACADAIKAIASRVTVESTPDQVKGYGAGAEAFARAMSLLNPPMKPIDPNLHASTRGVDPQSEFDAAAKAAEQDAQQQHELDKQAADQAHEAGMAAMQQTAQPEPQQPGGKPSRT